MNDELTARRPLVSSAALAVIPAVLVVLAATAIRGGFVSTLRINPDETAHLHGAWCLAHGQWPYRDYFEHHTPWLHLALAPLLSLFGVDRDSDRAVAFILTARGLMWVLATIAIGLTGWLAGLWKGSRTGWLAAALLATAVSFVEKTAEVRPDTPAVACLVGSWIAALKAWREAPDARRARWLLGLSGALTGAAVMFTQKAIFTLPAWGVLLAGWIVAGRADRSMRARVRGTLAFAGGALAPVALTLLLFELHGGARLFLEANFLQNARWRARLWPFGGFRRIFASDPILSIVGLAGALRALPRVFPPGALARGEALVVVHFVGLMAGAFVIPVPYLQYFAMLLPLVAVMAAGLLSDLADAAGRAASRLVPVRAEVVAPIVVSVGLLATVAGPMKAMVRRTQPEHPILAKHLAQIRYVLDHSSPDQTVMDGFTGAGMFRPHAWFYFFVHAEVRPLLGPSEIGDLQARLRDGDIAPTLVLLDEELWEVDDFVLTFLRANYEPTSDGVVHRLRRDLELDGRLRYRLDLGSGPADVLAGRGWDAPAAEGARSFRRTRGRRSTVRIPLGAPVEARLVLRARADEVPEEGRLGLFVNGAPAGEQRARAGWADYTFDVPPAAWKAGVNRVRLTHFVGPPGSDESGDALPLTLAVDEIELVPTGAAAP